MSATIATWFLTSRIGRFISGAVILIGAFFAARAYWRGQGADRAMAAARRRDRENALRLLERASDTRRTTNADLGTMSDDALGERLRNLRSGQGVRAGDMHDMAGGDPGDAT